MVDFDKLVKEKPIKAEITALIKRGNVTLAEYNALRCNSWEFEALVPALTIEALIATTEHAIKNCPRAESSAVTYTEAVQSVYTPELIHRLKECKEYVEIIDKLTDERDTLFDVLQGREDESVVHAARRVVADCATLRVKLRGLRKHLAKST